MSIIRGFIDIPPKAAHDYEAALIKKHGICEVPPSGRLNIEADGSITFAGLVCRDLGGRSTGTSAYRCRNCVLESEE